MELDCGLSEIRWKGTGEVTNTHLYIADTETNTFRG